MTSRTSGRKSGPILFAGGHFLSPEVFGPEPIRLMVRLGETGWTGGPVTVCIWDAAEGFPGRGHLARRTGRIDPDAGERSIVFMGLAPGRYAITAFADPSGKKRLRRTLSGRPASPVFLDRSMSWPRIMRFSEHARSFTRSTILELKHPSAEQVFGGHLIGDRYANPNSAVPDHVPSSGNTVRPAAPAHRR